VAWVVRGVGCTDSSCSVSSKIGEQDKAGGWWLPGVITRS